MDKAEAPIGTILSAALHLGGGALVVFGWPYLNPPAPEPLPPIPVELISEAELADRVEVQAQSRVEEPAEEPEPEPEPVEEEPEPEPPAIEAEPQPEPAPPEPEPTPEPEPDPIQEPEQQEPEPKPEPEPEQPEPDPDPQEEELDFAALGDLIDRDPDKRRDAPREVAPDAEGSTTDAERVGLGQELLATEEAMIRANIETKCWNRQSGVPNQEELIVTVNFRLTQQGQIDGTPRVVNARQIATSGNPFWRVARDRAVAAVQACAPYDYLSIERYEAWREIEMTFRPPSS